MISNQTIRTGWTAVTWVYWHVCTIQLWLSFPGFPDQFKTDEQTAPGFHIEYIAHEASLECPDFVVSPYDPLSGSPFKEEDEPVEKPQIEG